jgi:hypothetical protein
MPVLSVNVNLQKLVDIVGIPKNVVRIVIDLKPMDVAKLYYTVYPDERLIQDILETLDRKTFEVP